MEEFIKLTFVGDIMCLQEQNEAVYSKYGHYDYQKSLEPTTGLFQDSDYVIGNLETPICSQKLSDNPISFNTPVPFIEAIKRIGIRGVQTSNNHCLDRGLYGLVETIGHLNALGLGHFGTYANQEECKPINHIINLKGLKVGFFCCTYGTNSENNGCLLAEEERWHVELLKKQNRKSRLQWSPAMGPIITKMIPDSVKALAIDNSINHAYLLSIQQKVRELKQQSDIVVAMPHIGGQYNPSPGEYTRYVVRKIVEAGADMVIAGHPHVPLRTEWINQRFIAYSLGNFCFTPGVGYYLPNVLAEYGIVLHTYWSIKEKKPIKLTFSVVKNVVSDEGVSYTTPVYNLYHSLESRIAKEELQIENEAVVNRFCGQGNSVDVATEYMMSFTGL